jgi:serine/threonine protein kinase
MNQQTCNPDLLDAFLQNELSDFDEQQFTRHLDECADCREELESRAAERSAWQEASNMLGGPCRDLLPRLVTIERKQVRSPQIEQVLQQLAPTDDPAMLGRIGGYEVSGVVGAGGMGVVLKAHDRSLDRIVAIKVMSPHLASNGSARKRFAREAKAAAAVLHPNVIAIHRVASDDACPYLVMPYLRGASLQKRIDSQGPLPLKDTLRIGAQIAAGLAAAHEQGLVHRDIKPANILLEEGVERVTITDFGLARAVDDASMTCSGVIAGTPQYMSPEQTRREPIDARSDLFSLGSVLYAMCTGRSPFRAETTYGVLHRIANDNPTPICEVNSDVPVWLGHIIERLMAKRPDGRFESAAQVAELLEGCLAHVQQPAAIPLPHPVAALAPKKTRRPPIGKFIAAAAGAFALFFAGILIVLELGKGTLTIESELDDVPIRIMQGDEVVKSLTVSKEGATTRIGAGKYIVEIGQDFDKAVIKDGGVELSRGATAIVKVTQTNANTAEDEKAKDEAAKAWLRRPVVGSTHDGKSFQLAGHDALMHCVMTNNSEALNRLLTVDKYDLDFSPGNGQWTLLQTALQHSCLETTSLLLQHGANPNFASKGTPLPLELAKRSGRKELVALVQKYLAHDNANPRTNAVDDTHMRKTEVRTEDHSANDEKAKHSLPADEEPNATTSSKKTDGATELEGIWHLESVIGLDGKPRKLQLYDHWTFRGHRLLCEFAAAGHWACDVEVDSIAKTIRYLKDGKELPSNADYVLEGDQLTIFDQPPHRRVFRRGRGLIPVAVKTQWTADSLVTITFTGTTDGASITASGIGWRVDDAGHILVPSHVVPECDDEAIELRYASGGHCSATRLKILGHLTLLKSDQVVNGPAISLNSETSLTSGDAVSAILNRTDNVLGSIVEPRKTIALSELEGVKFNPELRFQNIITTDFVADDTTLSGAPLLTKDGDVAGMIIRLGSAQLIAIPVAEIREVLKQLQQVANSDPIRDHGLSTDSIETRTDGRFGILKIIEPTSLEDAVTKFNLLAKEHPLGRTQPELTVQEMTAAFRLWIASDECNEATRKDFQQVLDTQMLRPGHILQFNTKFETDGHLFEVWSIQFGDDKSAAWFKIRDSKLLSRLKTDEERKAWEQRIDQMKKSFHEYKRWGDRPKAYDTNPADNEPKDATKDSAVTLPPMEFDTLEDFLKPGRELFDKEMKQIDERLALVVEGSAEHSLLTTKKKQLQQQWDLSVAQVKGMAAAAKAGKPVQLAPIVIPNNSRPWQAPMPDPLSGHDEDIAKVLAGTWQVKRYVAGGEEAPLDGSTVTFSKNMLIMHFKLGDEEGDIQQVYRIGNDKIDIWDTDSGPDIRTALPYLGSYSLENDTLRICYHDRAMELETPQSRPPVQPGKGFIFLELQRAPIAEFGLMVDDKNSAKSSSHSNETRIDTNSGEWPPSGFELTEQQIQRVIGAQSARIVRALDTPVDLVVDGKSSLAEIVSGIVREHRISVRLNEKSFEVQGVAIHHVPAFEVHGVTLKSALTTLLEKLLQHRSIPPVIEVRHGVLTLAAKAPSDITTDLARSKPTSVVFQSMGPDKQALPETVVEVQGSDGVYFVLSDQNGLAPVVGHGVNGYTDDDGRFEFYAVPGKYTVKAVPDSGLRAEQEFAVVGTEPHEANMAISKNIPVKGRVVAGDPPIPMGRVTIQRKHLTDPFGCSGYDWSTNEAGELDQNYRDRDPMILWGHSEDKQLWGVTDMAWDDAEFEMKLAPRAEMKIRILDSDQKPVANTEFTYGIFRRIQPQYQKEENRQNINVHSIEPREGTTDENGILKLQDLIAGGDYMIHRTASHFRFEENPDSPIAQAKILVDSMANDVVVDIVLMNIGLD